MDRTKWLITVIVVIVCLVTYIVSLLYRGPVEKFEGLVNKYTDSHGTYAGPPLAKEANSVLEYLGNSEKRIEGSLTESLAVQLSQHVPAERWDEYLQIERQKATILRKSSSYIVMGPPPWLWWDSRGRHFARFGNAAVEDDGRYIDECATAILAYARQLRTFTEDLPVDNIKAATVAAGIGYTHHCLFQPSQSVLYYRKAERLAESMKEPERRFFLEDLYHRAFVSYFVLGNKEELLRIVKECHIRLFAGPPDSYDEIYRTKWAEIAASIEDHMSEVDKARLLEAKMYKAFLSSFSVFDDQEMKRIVDKCIELHARPLPENYDMMYRAKWSEILSELLAGERSPEFADREG